MWAPLNIDFEGSGSGFIVEDCCTPVPPDADTIDADALDTVETARLAAGISGAVPLRPLLPPLMIFSCLAQI